MFALIWLLVWIPFGGLHLPETGTGWSVALAICLGLDATRVRLWYKSLP